MKKIKLLSLFLAVLMLAGMATLFSSCAGTEPGVITPSEETVDIDFTGYTALYGETQGTSNITRTVRSRFESFAENLSAVTGVNVKIMQCGRKAPEEGAKEILIGLTDREESKAALEEIVSDGFVIQVLEDKIVIIGTSNLYTAMAVDYFEKTYVTGKEKSKTLTVNESVLACEMTSVTLTNSSYKNDDVETKAYTYVYKNGLGMVPNAYSSLATDVSQPNFNELPMTVATKLTESMAGISRLAQKFYPVGNDATVKEKEVLIGITNRDESKAALAQIDETQYIITVIGERVVLTAWSNMILNQAVEAYTDIMKEATMKDAEGNTVVCLPRDFRLIGNGDHDWVTDFPKPEGEGIALNSTMDNNDNSLQYIYTGTGVTEAAYNAYVAQLKTAGYKEVQSTSAEGSIFKFFKNTAKDVALYVAYNAYAHKDEYADYDYAIIKQIDNKAIDPYGFESTIRIVSSTIANAYLPTADVLGNATHGYDYVTETTITSVPIYYQAVGHCYIITLEDGRFIVYDGGGTNSGGAREYDTMMNVLRELNKRATNKETSKDNPVHIAAWVLSHAHWDHYAAFSKLLSTYGRSGELRMDYMVANIPSEEAYCSEDFEEVADVMTPDIIGKLQASITGGFQLIKPHTGMKFHFANVSFETLTTWEDLSPVMCSNSNDTNTVFRLTISSQNSSDSTTLMWLGDANRLQSRFMCATFGTYLKADMSTVAHHGNAGCEIELYEMIDPETLFWTHHAKAVQDYLDPTNKGWMAEVDQYFTYKLASVKRIFANGGQMFTSGSGTVMDQVAGGYIPPQDGYLHLCFNEGVADFDDVKELHFLYEDVNGKWITTSVSETSLAHTDISGGAEAFQKNPTGVMVFASNYMVKCDQGCPTGQHTH